MGKNTKQVCLSDEDNILFENAVKKYNMPESTLLNKIISAWLFANKLNIETR